MKSLFLIKDVKFFPNKGSFEGPLPALLLGLDSLESLVRCDFVLNICVTSKVLLV